MGWYREWHQWKLHHHFHIAVLVFYIASILLGTLGAFLPGSSLAATKDWTFDENPPSASYAYGTEVNVSGGTASLGSHTPSTDWIATDVNNWMNRRAITINNPGSSAFQVKLSGLDTQQGGKMHYDGTDCEDLRFTSSDGVTVIPHWVESASCNSASTDVWVKVPQSVPTIYMYYNNSNEALTSTSSDTAVFEKVIGNLQGAWQLGDNPGGAAQDSSGNNISGTLYGTTQTPDKNGIINLARNFGAAPNADYLYVVNNAALMPVSALSMSVWARQNGAFAGENYIIERSNGNYGSFLAGYSLSVTSGGSIVSHIGIPFYYGGYGSDYICSTADGAFPTDNSWTNITVTYDAANGWNIYKNGASIMACDAPVPGDIGYYLAESNDLFIGTSFQPSSDWDGDLDEVKIYNDILTGGAGSEAEALGAQTNRSYLSPTLHPNTEYIHKYTANISAGAPESEDTYYYNNYPTIQNQEGVNGFPVNYVSAIDFATGGTGSVKFQASPDNGTTWYWYTGGAWTETTGGYTEANTESEIETGQPIQNFHPGAGGNPYTYFRWRAYFISDGTQQPTITNVSITYFTDTAAPDNPVIGGVTCYENDGVTPWTYDAGQLWHKYSAPKFVWAQPSDNNNGGLEANSDIWRYYAKLTTDSGYTPTPTDATTNNYLVASGLTNGQTYYLRVKTIDNAENESAAATLLTYKYDNVAPSDPTNVQVDTLQPSEGPFSFNWGASTDVGNPGERSEYDHYEYKKGAISDWTEIDATSVSGLLGDEDGNNVFRVRAVDKAGNVSGEDTVTYQYILNAPSEPLSVQVDDQEKTENNFTFTWEAPNYVELGHVISGYRYSVNNMPNANNTTNAGDVLTTGSIHAATQQGTNRFYVVAYDDEAKINYSNYGWVDFNVNTTATAPTAPQTVVISDVSDRHKPDHYALALSWKAPSNYSPNTFGRYNIRRATSLAGLANDSDWLARPPDGTTSTPAYAEAGLTKDQMYYYRVSGVDNAGAEVALSEIVAKAPTGKYIEPPTDTPPSVSVTATSATVTWTTDRISYSKVEYGKAPSYGMQNSSLQTTNNHSVTLYGLDPGTTYHYRTQSLDPSDQEDYDDSLAYSEDLTFATQPAPGISDVKISDIRLDSALVTWKTTSSAVSTLKYGETNSYGKEISDSSGSAVTTHTVKLNGLDHSSTYHFKLFGTDTDGNVMQSDDYNFDTLTFPKVSNVNLQQVKGTATSTMKVTWESNVPVSSVVLYTDPTGKTMEAAQSELETKHEMIISGLKDNTEYTLAVKGRDAYGNEGSSGSEKVKTDFDTRPPLISEITTETSINGYGASAKSQLVVSWYTDEPATSQVEYAKGVTGDTFSFATQEDAALSTSHVVVASDLDPSSAYYFKTVSKDSFKNEAKSETGSVLTEQARSSIFDLVLKSFESTLGWLFGGK